MCFHVMDKLVLCSIWFYHNNYYNDRHFLQNFIFKLLPSESHKYSRSLNLFSQCEDIFSLIKHADFNSIIVIPTNKGHFGL